MKHNYISMENITIYYWGTPDTTVQFCEKKYDAFSWIAEYDNTFSALPYILIGLMFRITKIKNIGNALILLGFSTIIMHGTLRYYGQWFDECSLFYLSFETIRLLKKNISFLYLLVLLSAYFYFKNNYFFFLSTFTILQTIIIYLVIYKKKTYIQHIFIKLYISTFLLASLFWILDQQICTTNEYFPYHALWHFFSAISMLYGFLSFIL